MPNVVPYEKWKEKMPEWLKKRNRAGRRDLVSGTVRPFLAGKNTELDAYALGIIRKFIKFKESRALRKNPFALDFTRHEQKAIRNGFYWLVRGMQPGLAPREALHIVNANLKKSRKIRANDVIDYMETSAAGLVGNKFKEKDGLYGRVSMLMDAIDHTGKLHSSPELSVYIGLAFHDRVLFSGNTKPPNVLEKTAAHELGHHYYHLDEPLCYAIGEYYQYAHGNATLRDIELDLVKENDRRYGYLQGLIILRNAVLEAARRGIAAEETFWPRLRELAKRKEYQWH